MDIERQVEYWRKSALDDLDAARILAQSKKINQGLFFAHLAIEKSLKAVVCRNTRATPPFIHDLSRLAHLSGLGFGERQSNLLARASTFGLRGRYELPVKPLISEKETEVLLNEVEDLVRWLIQL